MANTGNNNGVEIENVGLGNEEVALQQPISCVESHGQHADAMVTCDSHKGQGEGGWWKLNSNKYPIMSEVARAILAVLVSTVASESTFNAGGRILDPFRSCLPPEKVEALICAQNWLKKATKIIDLKHELDLVATIEKLGNDLSYVVNIE